VGSDDGVLMLFVCRHEFVEKSEELVYLLAWKVGVVSSVLDFECVHVFALARHDVRQGIKTGVAYRHANGIVPVFLEEFDEYGFAVEASFAPPPKGDLVDFFHTSVSGGVCDKKLLHTSMETVFG
jgi:hypothetical protein